MNCDLGTIAGTFNLKLSTFSNLTIHDLSKLTNNSKSKCHIGRILSKIYFRCKHCDRQLRTEFVTFILTLVKSPNNS